VAHVIIICKEKQELNVKNLTNQCIRWVGDGGIPTGVMIKPKEKI